MPCWPRAVPVVVLVMSTMPGLQARLQPEPRAIPKTWPKLSTTLGGRASNNDMHLGKSAPYPPSWTARRQAPLRAAGRGLVRKSGGRGQTENVVFINGKGRFKLRCFSFTLGLQLPRFGFLERLGQPAAVSSWQARARHGFPFVLAEFNLAGLLLTLKHSRASPDRCAPRFGA